MAVSWLLRCMRTALATMSHEPLSGVFVSSAISALLAVVCPSGEAFSEAVSLADRALFGCLGGATSVVASMDFPAGQGADRAGAIACAGGRTVGGHAGTVAIIDGAVDISRRNKGAVGAATEDGIRDASL